MRRALTGSLALTRRRPAKPSAGSPAACDPAPERPRAPRPSQSELAVAPQPGRTGWIARLFRRKPRQAEPVRRPPARRRPESPFTPDAYPRLSPDACAILNTPVQDLDPELLRVMLSALARYLAAQLPPELGLDAQAVFARMAQRVGMAPGTAPVEMPPPMARQPAPAPSQDAPQAAPVPPAPSQDVPHAPPPPPAEAAATVNAAADARRPAREITSAAAEPAPPARLRTGVRSAASRASRRHASRDRRDSRRLSLIRNIMFRPRPAPPARRLTYAACAGPP